MLQADSAVRFRSQIPLVGFGEAESSGSQPLVTGRHGLDRMSPWDAGKDTARLERDSGSRRTILRPPVQYGHLKRIGLLGADQRPDRQLTLGRLTGLLSDHRRSDRVNAQKRVIEWRRSSPPETLLQRRISEPLLRERVQTERAAKLTDPASELLPRTLLQDGAAPLGEWIAPTAIRVLPELLPPTLLQD